ncbi:ABC transporter permease [Roseibium denhamense]|uniref:Spermidine/putrescine transport system permease protein n=1 Tax=Roseibium denhamense TaxID=76305 RepID=A0ABY1PIY4_9HYPH|nr:ABC transporter permease [Roseibium denhamense]MTI05594.1 ABC transporter permease [Roseibium denhamense]SMP34535.1 putative spermidine/putrescine transport system permease protein [Roseibium denhamense]
MRRNPPQKPADYLPIAFPAAMLALFFVVPFGIMVAISVFKRVQGGFYEPAFTLDNYARFLTPFFGEVLMFSLALAAIVSVVCLLIGVPFTYLLTRIGRRYQVLWLITLLAVLSLSEVIIGFAWSTLLSRTAGLSNFLVFLSIMDKPEAWTPGFGAVMTGLVYQAFPYTVLVLYPAFSRLDPSLMEAARTLGSSPLRAFWNVVLPIMRKTLLATFIIVFIFALGAYLLPQILGRPQHWTLSVLVTDQAIYQSNMPFAAAMAVFLVLSSLFLVGLSILVSEKKGIGTP